MTLLDTIKKRADFLEVKNNKNAVRVITSGFILSAYFTPQKRLEQTPKLKNITRYGITVTKKLSKKAVERNKIKRRLREAIRKSLSQLGISKIDYIFIARHSALTREFARLFNDVERGITEANRELIKLCKD